MRPVCAWLVGVGLAALLCQPALALVYVPGQHREDGLYIRPHFERQGTPIDDAWFKGQADPVAAKKDGKLPTAGNDPARAKVVPDAGR